MEQTKHITMREYEGFVRLMSRIPDEKLRAAVMEHIKKPPLFVKATMRPSGRTSTFRLYDREGYYHHDAGEYGFTLGERNGRYEMMDMEGAARDQNPSDNDEVVEITEAEYEEDNRGYYNLGTVDRMLNFEDEDCDDDDIPY